MKVKQMDMSAGCRFDLGLCRECGWVREKVFLKCEKKYIVINKRKLDVGLREL